MGHDQKRPLELECDDDGEDCAEHRQEQRILGRVECLRRDDGMEDLESEVPTAKTMTMAIRRVRIRMTCSNFSQSESSVHSACARRSLSCHCIAVPPTRASQMRDRPWA